MVCLGSSWKTYQIFCVCLHDHNEHNFSYVLRQNMLKHILNILQLCASSAQGGNFTAQGQCRQPFHTPCNRKPKQTVMSVLRRKKENLHPQTLCSDSFPPGVSTPKYIWRSLSPTFLLKHQPVSCGFVWLGPENTQGWRKAKKLGRAYWTDSQEWWG